MAVSIFVCAVFFFRTGLAKPLGGRWITFDMGNATEFYDYNEEASTEADHVSSTCFKTLPECNSRCPVSCREINDCGGLPGTQYACSWDLVIIVVAVAVLAAVLLLLCLLTWKQRQSRRRQLEYGRVSSNENLLRRSSRQRAGSIIAATISSTDSGDDSRRSSYQPYPQLANITSMPISVSPSRLYPHYL